MSIKNILFISLFLTANCAYSSILATAFAISQMQKRQEARCAEKVTKQRQPLFIQAEKREQNFINAHAQCLQANDCDTNSAYAEARHRVVYTVLELANHIEKLKQDNGNACNKGEKVEAKDIKKRLLKLLNSTR